MNQLPDTAYDDAELAAAIDVSFGDGPPPPPIGATILLGRRAHRRRATLRATGGTALAAAAAAAFFLVPDGTLTGSGPGSDLGVATTPSVSSTPSAPTPAQTRAVERLRDDVATLLTDTGELDASRLPGAVVAQQVDDPTRMSLGGRSYGVVVQRDGVEVWCLLEWYRTGALTSCEPAGAGEQAGRDAAFEDYVARMTRSTGSDIADEPSELVTLMDDGTVVGALGTEIVQQRVGIDLGPRFAAPGDRTAAVEAIDGTGRRWYLLARQTPGTPVDVVPVDPRDSRPTFERFLDQAAETYAGGPTAGFR